MRLGKGSYFLGTDHGHNTIVGNFTSIAGGVYIHGPDNHACVANHKLVSTFDWGSFGMTFSRSGITKGEVIIGNDVWIGEGVQILSGVIIGDGVMVGAHTVIGKSVPPYAVIVGNPYQIKRYRFPRKVIKKLLEIKWWDWDDQKLRDHINEMADIDELIRIHG